MTQPRSGFPRLPGGTNLRRETWQRRLRAARERRSRTRGNRSLLWRAGVPVAFALSGTLLVTSAISSDGTDLRAESYGDLDSVVRQQNRQVEALNAESAALAEEVDTLSARVDDHQVEDLQQRIDELRGPAGLQAVEGPGLTVTLNDAPTEVIEDADVPPDYLVVHQQDIQAVVNAMWSGGAEAITIQDQRVISTTGIKCVGNTVRLHGAVYSPPYVISAVGDTSSMLDSINGNEYIGIYQDYAEEHELGYDLEVESHLEMPAFEGTLDLDHARTAGTPDTGSVDSEL